jgi:hypothetical protein
VGTGKFSQEQPWLNEKVTADHKHSNLFSYLSFIQRLVRDVQDLVKNLVDIGVIRRRGILIGPAIRGVVVSIRGPSLRGGLLLPAGVHSRVAHGRLVGGTA